MAGLGPTSWPLSYNTWLTYTWPTGAYPFVRIPGPPPSPRPTLRQPSTKRTEDYSSIVVPSPVLSHSCVVPSYLCQINFINYWDAGVLACPCLPTGSATVPFYRHFLVRITGGSEFFLHHPSTTKSPSSGSTIVTRRHAATTTLLRE